jgi:hypothetical protein
MRTAQEIEDLMTEHGVKDEDRDDMRAALHDTYAPDLDLEEHSWMVQAHLLMSIRRGAMSPKRAIKTAERCGRHFLRLVQQELRQRATGTATRRRASSQPRPG